MIDSRYLNVLFGVGRFSGPFDERLNLRWPKESNLSTTERKAPQTIQTFTFSVYPTIGL
jgi:hypothetical protein